MTIHDTTGVELEQPTEAADRRMRWGTLAGNSWIVLVLIALVVVFSVMNPNFFTLFNLTSILVNASVLAIVAVGQTWVIVTGGIDLSVGSALVFASVVAAIVMSAMGGTNAGIGAIVVGSAVGIAGGLLWGLFNGIIVAKTKVPPLIVTLGSLGMALGLAQIFTGGVDITNVPDALVQNIGFAKIFGIPVLVVIAVFVIAIGQIALKLTRFGRQVTAIGSNAEAARRASIKVPRQLIRVYALQGLLVGIAGVLSLARFSNTTIAGHSGDNLTVISGVVLAGTSLFGGRGSVVGTAVGILIPVVLQSGLVIVGLPPFWQTVLIGAILIIAVYIDQVRSRSRASG